MKYCPNRECPYRREVGHPAEYRDDIERCSDCDAALVDGALVPVQPKPEHERDGMVPIVRIGDPAMVPIVESLLIAEEIPYFVHSVNAQDLFGVGRIGAGFNVISGAPTLYVEPDRRDEVMGLLATHTDRAFDELEADD